VTGSLVAFLGLAILVIVTPGPDTALTVRNTLIGGRAAGVFTALGVVGGQLVWATAASLGVVAVLLASAGVFYVVKLAGAGYLVVLGLHSLLTALRRGDAEVSWVTAGARARLRPAVAIRQGVLNNLGNPKMAAFFASVLPQFAPPGHGMLSGLVVLAVIFSALTFTWLVVYALAVSTAGGLLRRPRLRRAIEAAAGIVLIGLGLRVATEPR
jgi:threonine/homoserine/homoserine lactone efflux protein